MKINLIRTDFTALSTIGKMSLDGLHAYCTLELPWGNGANVHKVNCILPGTYEVIIDFSPLGKILAGEKIDPKSTDNGRDMPHILNVPGRDEIRIHVGNYSRDTEGCVLIGLSKGLDFIGNSKTAFDDFFPRLTTALENDKVYVEISNQLSET